MHKTKLDYINVMNIKGTSCNTKPYYVSIYLSLNLSSVWHMPHHFRPEHLWAQKNGYAGLSLRSVKCTHYNFLGAVTPTPVVKVMAGILMKQHSHASSG